MNRAQNMEVEDSCHPSITWTKRKLFGGAITCLIPENSIDASTLREVPDHQEVFCNKHTDQSIIVDILEYQEQSQGEEAPRYHFLDIAEANDALDNTHIESVEQINRQDLSMTQCHEAWYLSGMQKVAKFNDMSDARNTIHLQLGLLRLPNFGSDIVITMNSPLQLSNNSSSHQQAQEDIEAIWSNSYFKKIISSLAIIDTSLFM